MGTGLCNWKQAISLLSFIGGLYIYNNMGLLLEGREHHAVDEHDLLWSR